MKCTVGNVRISTPARFFCPEQKLYVFLNFKAFDFFWDVSIFLSDFVQFTDRNKMTSQNSFPLIVAVLDFVER